MEPDEVKTFVDPAAPEHVHDNTEHYTADEALGTFQRRWRRARIEMKVSAVGTPTTLAFWAQFRTAEGTRYDCQQQGTNAIMIDDVLAKVTPTPVQSVLIEIEGDEIRIGYRGEGCDATTNYFSIDELRLIKMV